MPGGTIVASGTQAAAVPAPAGTAVSIAEIIETCGISPVLFNLEALDDFAAIIERHLPFARVYVKRRVGNVVWNTADADQATQVKEAVLYKCGARVLFAARVQRVTGTGAPLLMAGPEAIEKVVRDLDEAADVATDAAILTAPNDPENLQESAHWTADPTREAAFKSGADTRY